MKKALVTAAVIALASVGAAQAATVKPSSAVIITEGPRGTVDNRDIIGNAFDGNSNTFFELGYNAVVDFIFNPNFSGRYGMVVETTNGSRSSFIEKVMIQVGFTDSAGVFTLIDTAAPNPVSNQDAATRFTFSGIGPFNTIRMTDVTCTTENIAASGGACRAATGGFDVAELSVAAVPLPAGGFLLIGALGGLAALRRRKARAA